MDLIVDADLYFLYYQDFSTSRFNTNERAGEVEIL